MNKPVPARVGKWPLYIFSFFVFVSLLTPIWVFTELLFPYITSKAFFFRICMEAALPFYLFLVISQKNLRPKLKNPLNITVLAFVAINIISAFSGVNVPRSLWGNFERMGGAYYLVHLALLCFYLQLLGQAGGNYLKRFLQSFILVASLVAINGLSGWLGGPHLIQDPSLPVRVSSTFGNPIFFASYLIIPTFLAAFFALQEENFTLKIFYWIAALLQLLGIYSSGTRGAVVGLLAALFLSGILYVILTDKPRIRRYGFLGIGLVILLVGGLYAYRGHLAPGTTLHRIVNLRDSNTEARLIQWRIALTGYKDHALLGVGPENYYIISNTYYNPDMYQYDASWFDKPHNFLLEVLVTNGALGFAAYAGMVLFSFYALWKAYKSGLLTLLEMCLLLAGAITYQVQNLFVFDTVSASVAFFGFLGFATYLWIESGSAKEPSKQVIKSPSLSGATAVFVVALLAVLYVEYTSNIASLQASKRTNFGMVYTQHDPQVAANYFASALALPLNLDPRETANRYSDFAIQIAGSNLSGLDPGFAGNQLDQAAKAERAVAEKTGNDPLLWFKLGADELTLAKILKQDTSVSKTSIDKAISLAPKRVELLQLLLQYYGERNEWSDALKVAEKMVEINPYKPALQWQVALTYYLNGQLEDAVKAGDKAIGQGFEFNQLQQFYWYIQYYQKKGDFQKLVPLLERAIVLEPNEIDLYVELAKAYAAIGDKDRAIAIARQVQQSDASQKAAMDEFINNLR